MFEKFGWSVTNDRVKNEKLRIRAEIARELTRKC